MKEDTTAHHTNGTDTASKDLDFTDLVHDIVAVTWDLKALNTVAIDLRGHVSYTDFVIVCTGTSERHVQSIARRLDTAMRESGRPPLGAEGIEFGRWALLDYGDIIIHVFNGEARHDYNLERMWPEAPRLEFEDKPRDLYGRFDMEQFSP